MSEDSAVQAPKIFEGARYFGGKWIKAFYIYISEFNNKS